MRQHEFPRAACDGVELVVLVVIPVSLVGILRAFDPFEQGQEILAVDLAFGEGCADESGEGGKEVDIHSGFVADRAGGDGAGPAHHGRLADAAFPRGALAFAEGAGGSGVGAVGEPGSVVARENDEGVPGEPVCVDGVEDLADGPIEFGDDVAEEAAFRRSGEAFADIERHVRLGVGDVEEEGLLAMAVDEIDGTGREPGRHHALVVLVGDAEALVPFVERQRGKVFRGGMLRPHVVRVGDAEVFIKALLEREKLLMIAKVPFAEGGCGVTL